MNAQKYWEGGGPGWSRKRRAPPVINTLPSVDISLSGCSWAVISYNESVNARKCFLEFCEPFCQVIKPEEGLMRTPTCSQLVRCTGDNLTCVWCLKWRHSCGNGVLTCGIWCYLQVCVCVHVCVRACMRVLARMLVTQSCLILCHPMDCSPPSSCVYGILQARILEWVAILFSMVDYIRKWVTF